MIVDLKRFIKEEQPFWTELEEVLERRVKDPDRTMDIPELRRFHYLYQRASADLSRIATFSSEKNIRMYLEGLVAQAYGEIHEGRGRHWRPKPMRWFLVRFPETFRAHIRAFALAVFVTLLGAVFGAGALGMDEEAREALMPFEHLWGNPGDRVAMEEQSEGEDMAGHHASFASELLTHNIQVSILAMGAGISWGIGTLLILLTNGVILGAVCADYILAGEGVFLAGWLLPHGVVEIPAILIAAQAGLVLAGAVIGSGARENLSARLVRVSGDLVTLAGGMAVMLVWAGIIESFLSQYHAPVLPYSVKIGFGCAELCVLVLFLSKSGEAFYAKAARVIRVPGPVSRLGARLMAARTRRRAGYGR